MSIIGSSICVMAAGVPFNGPIGAVRIGRKDGKFIINPTKEEIDTGDMNLLVAGPKGLTNMIECDAKQVPDAVIEEAFALGQKHIDRSIDAQQEFLKKCTITPKEIAFNKPTDFVLAEVAKVLTTAKIDTMMGHTKVSFNDMYYQYEKEALEACKGKIDEATQEECTQTKIKMAVFALVKKEIRKRTLHSDKRFDDRTVDQVRPLYCEVGLFPRVHGTGLFRRGDTQVLSTVSLGSPSDTQKVDDMENDATEERYIHHYNFAPFSTNEAQGTRGPGRREIGHGALAEKALFHVIPAKEEFPYTIRVVSECLSSGGSTSQASVCGSTLALMDAGVPIKAPVAGIAM